MRRKKGNTAMNIDDLPAIEPCGELEPISEELAPLIADLPAIEPYGEIEPMSEELWHRRRATTTMPRRPHKTRKSEQAP
jgi:hypothetical protein